MPIDSRGNKGIEVGPQFVMRDRCAELDPHAPDNLRHAAGRNAVLIPFRERGRAHANECGERNLRPTHPITLPQRSIHTSGFLHPKLKVNNPLPIAVVDRNQYHTPMVKPVKLPTPRQPSEFATFADWIREICESATGANTALASIMGVSQASITHYCSGKIPRSTKLRQLADALSIDPDDLLLLAARSDKSFVRHNRNPASVPPPTAHEEGPDSAETAELLMHWRRMTNRMMRRAMIEHVRTLNELMSLHEDGSTASSGLKTVNVR